MTSQQQKSDLFEKVKYLTKRADIGTIKLIFAPSLQKVSECVLEMVPKA